MKKLLHVALCLLLAMPLAGQGIGGQSGIGGKACIGGKAGIGGGHVAGPQLINYTAVCGGSNGCTTTGTQPFNSSTYVPPSGSAAINAGTSLTGAMGLMPVRFQFNPSTSTITLRAYPTTIGALDQGAAPVVIPAAPTELGVLLLAGKR